MGVYCDELLVLFLGRNVHLSACYHVCIYCSSLKNEVAWGKCSDSVDVLDESFVAIVVAVVVVVVCMTGSCYCCRYCSVAVVVVRSAEMNHSIVVTVYVVDDDYKSVVVFEFVDVVMVVEDDEVVVMFVADGDRSFALVVVVADRPEVI